jgi:predicted HicB family RNase H-like nuclease
MTAKYQRTEIDLAPLLAGLEQPLQLIGDPQAREQLQAYVNAARPHVERAAFDVLSQVVNSFNDANPDQRAYLEYADGGLHIRLEATADNDTETSFNDSDLEKVTLRLPRELKELIDTAAGRHGISANNWYVRALSRIIARDVRDSLRDAAREGRRGDPAREGRPEGRRGFYRGRGGGSLRGFVGGDSE